MESTTVSILGIFQLIVSIILLIVFLVMAYKIGQIRKYIYKTYLMEFRNPVNYFDIKCESCKRDVKISKSFDRPQVCPQCGHYINLPKDMHAEP
jgi:DNA-directed RNA polymerase subunit RPC12/RpoP